MIWDIVIVGAGAAGLAAAIQAKRHCPKAGVLVIDRLGVPGKKLSVTGNGRGNIGNTNATPNCYRPVLDGSFLKIFHQISTNELMELYREWGIEPVVDGDLVYPYSYRAASVTGAMVSTANMLGVKFCLDTAVQSVAKKDNIFWLQMPAGKPIGAKQLVLCCGGRSQKKFGSDGSGFALAKQLGHSWAPLYPALTAVVTAEGMGALAGVRADRCRTTLLQGGQPVAEQMGQVQFADYGLSGIPIMQLCVNPPAPEEKISLDFMPQYTWGQLTDWLIQRQSGRANLPVKDYLQGVFADPLAQYLMQKAGLSAKKMVGELPLSQLQSLCNAIKNSRWTVAKRRGYDFSQVTGGGIVEDEIDLNGQSKLLPGLFFAGEMLNVAGLCGGYNLRWAFVSGSVAGRTAAEHIR